MAVASKHANGSGPGGPHPPASGTPAASPELNGFPPPADARSPEPAATGERQPEPRELQLSVPPTSAASPSPSPSHSPAQPDRLSALAAYLWVCLSRPRVRLALIGVVLLLTGGLMMTNSVWTLPLVGVGSAMVVTAWIGHRLDGRVVLEWGESGTELAFRAKLKTPEPVPEPPPRTSSTTNAQIRSVQLDHKPAEIIEGEAHTIEIDVAELKALIAAAQDALDGGDSPGDGRGARGAEAGHSADSPR